MKKKLKSDKQASYKFSIFVSWQQILNYVYIIDERNNQLFFLEDMAMEIWLEIFHSVKKTDILNSLCFKYKEFKTERIRCLILEFIGKLLEEELIYES